MSDKIVAESYVEYMKNRFPESKPRVLELISSFDDRKYYEAVIDEKLMYKIFLRYHGSYQPYGYEIYENFNSSYKYIDKIYELFKKQKYMTIDKIQEILKEYNIEYKIEKFKPEEVKYPHHNAYLIFDNNDGSMIKWHIDIKENRCYYYDYCMTPKYHEYLMNVIKDLKQNINIILNMINEKSKKE